VDDVHKEDHVEEDVLVFQKMAISVEQKDASPAIR
jgi:hypothetical protein